MKKTLILAIIGLFFASCNISGKGKVTFDEGKFNEQKTAWENNNTQNYSYSLKYSSNSTGGLPKIRITVRNNEATSMVIEETNNEIDAIESTYVNIINTINKTYHHIESLSNDLKTELKEPNSKLLSAKIKVEYNEQYHFPTKIHSKGTYEFGLDGGLSETILITDFQIDEPTE